LGDVLTDLAIYGGMGYRVIQRDEQLVFETYMIRDRSRYIRFSIENGSLSEEEILVSPPEVTRPLVGGQGKGGDRIIVQRTTAESLAAEAAWGRKIEAWIDKRNTEDIAELNQEGDAVLVDGGFTSTAVKAVPNDETSMVYMDE